MRDQHATSQISAPLDTLCRDFYIRQALIFSLDESVDVKSIYNRLSHALSLLLDHAPQLAQYVIDDPEGQQHFGTRLTGPDRSADLILSFNDDTANASYEAFHRSRFSMSLMRDSFVPDEGRAPKQSSPSGAPVMLARATEIQGGLVLCVCLHHGFCDVTALGEILRAWAAASLDLSKDHSTGEEAIQAATRDMVWSEPRMACGTGRASIYEFPQFRLSADMVQQPVSAIATAAAERNPVVWQVFGFSYAAIQEIKNLSKAATLDPGVSYVSTHDLILSMLWANAVRARQLEAAEPTPGILVATDLRRRLTPKLPQAYMRNAVMATRAEADLGVLQHASLLSASVNPVACSVRQAIGRIDENVPLRFISMLRHTRAEKGQRVRAKFTPGRDLWSTSWLHLDVCDMDWGQHLGKCAAFRAPQLGGTGMILFLPKGSSRGLQGTHGPEGQIEVTLALHADEMRRFKALDTTRRYMTF